MTTTITTESHKAEHETIPKYFPKTHCKSEESCPEHFYISRRVNATSSPKIRSDLDCFWN